MTPPPSSTFSCKHQARCVAAVAADTERSRFLAATCALRDSNELYLLEHDEDTGKVVCEGVFGHEAGEVRAIAPCPDDASLLFTVHGNRPAGAPASDWAASLWKLSDDEGGSTQALQPMAALPAAAHGGRVRQVLWQPGGSLTVRHPAPTSARFHFRALYRLGRSVCLQRFHAQQATAQVASLDDAAQVCIWSVDGEPHAPPADRPTHRACEPAMARDSSQATRRAQVGIGP